MMIDVEGLVDAIAAGNAAQIDEAIDHATDPDPVDRVHWYGDLLDACQPRFESRDGSVRQSVVRLLRESYPALELRLGVGEADEVGGIRLEDTEAHRYRYVELLLQALDDNDSRVREAAIDAMDVLAPALAAAELEDETEALQDVLSQLAVCQPEERRRHTERAMRLVGRPELDRVMADVQFWMDRD